ncbi:hypothetical protein C8Q76DRAFT_209244 [Earliella scabrosa]|nr:hypothetical protein C8Q76DRAFT_209244 [Earliella scabrosa]
MPESTLSALGLLSNLPTLDETYGALLLGTFAGLILYGVFLHQAYRYARVYAKDHLTNKSFVLCVVLVDTVHNIVSMHACYAYLVNNYFNPLALLRGIWSIQIQPLLAVSPPLPLRPRHFNRSFQGFAVLTCQSFFARRVYILNTKHRVLVALSVLLTCITMAFAIAGTVIAFKYHTFAQYEHFYWIDSAACGAAIASDSLTASVLIWTLRRSRTGFRQYVTRSVSLLGRHLHARTSQN